MAAFDTITRVGYRAWRYTWTDTGNGPYALYLWGRPLVAHAEGTEITLDAEDYDPHEPPPLEIRDSTDVGNPVSVDYPPYLELQWRGRTTNDHYSVERWMGSAWEVVTRVAEIGRGYYRYTTPRLDDGETHRWRVVPYDPYGQSGEPVPFDVFLVCVPEPPRIALSYSNDTGALTVSARA